MAIIEWWNSLSLVAQIFYCIAVPSTLVLLIQTILMFIGMGEEADADGADTDVSEDVDVDGNEDVGFDEDLDPNGLDGLRIFTVRGVIAFLVIFGWVGALLESMNVALWINIPVSSVCGFAMMVLLAFIFKAIMNLRSDGTIDIRNAVGTAGKVHLTIPPARMGEGKVHILLQGSYVERDAVTDEPDPIPTGSEVVVVRVSGETTLVVRKK
ncbi:MAG: NfeD family protein [Clostridia bacterium]|nr:NfeD family protein [Clostridia bacterium]MBO7216124.1 NfeD family protein [Clostridia bacterium]MBO7245843.1 NfeD family protein [Clostridia bacterium]MBO7738059.1 NfeD family protein [Clostridia bacterium]